LSGMSVVASKSAHFVDEVEHDGAYLHLCSQVCRLHVCDTHTAAEHRPHAWMTVRELVALKAPVLDSVALD
jgi:hypothetical protein